MGDEMDGEIKPTLNEGYALVSLGVVQGLGAFIAVLGPLLAVGNIVELLTTRDWVQVGVLGAAGLLVCAVGCGVFWCSRLFTKKLRAHIQAAGRW